MFLWVVLAWADPTVAFRDDGLLHASIEIAAPAEQVHAVLGDARRVASWSPEVLSMEAVGEGTGGCRDYEVKTKGLWNPLSYVVRRCRVGSGYQERLVRSDDFTRVQADWTVVEVEGGVRVDYVGTVDVNVPVPRAVLRKAQSTSLTGTLLRLAKEAVLGVP